MSKPVELKLFETLPEIEAGIKSIGSRGATLQRDMHKVACSVLKHVGTHGDVRVVQKLVLSFIQAMPKMARVNSLKKWFETFGPLKFAGNKVSYVRDGKTRLGDAIGKPFWKFAANEGVEYVPLDLAKVLERMIESIEKDADKTGRDHSALLASLEIQLASIGEEATAH